MFLKAAVALFVLGVERLLCLFLLWSSCSVCSCCGAVALFVLGVAVLSERMESDASAC
jgi:hypothetical protein